MMELRDAIALARGEREVDLCLKNARVINVISAKIEPRNVAVAGGVVVGFGDYPSRHVIDLQGMFLAPAFIDPHVHIESSMVTPREYARTVLPHGVTTAVTDFHEIANVLGTEGIRLMFENVRPVPFNLYCMLPSCVPATPLETSGARISAEDLRDLMTEEWALGLGEMMNFPGVVHRTPEVLKKLELAGTKKIDGHAPGLSGKDLTAYIVAGISSDHECTSRKEAEEKLVQGMHIMIREGSAAKNLEELILLVTPKNARRCMFASDDRHPADLIAEGSIDLCVKKAIQRGIDPVTAIQMATINPAEYFSLPKLGAIAPGYRADLAVIEDMKAMKIWQVYKDGRMVAERGGILSGPWKGERIRTKNTFNMALIGSERLRIAVQGNVMKVIEVIPEQIVTKKIVHPVKEQNGCVVADLQRDILKVAVVERHKGTGNVGIGFVKGFGLQKGVIGSSVAHDSHNIVVVGVDDNDMTLAVRTIAEMGGGLIAVQEGTILDSLPLPVAGLMSDSPMEEVRGRLDSLHHTVREMGGTLTDPFMTLSFLALPVIPELKVTDKGLVDVERFKIVPLFGED